MDNGFKILYIVKGYHYNLMEIFMMASGKIIKDTEQAHIIGMMEIDTLVNGLKDKEMEKDNFGGLMVTNILDLG